MSLNQGTDDLFALNSDQLETDDLTNNISDKHYHQMYVYEMLMDLTFIHLGILRKSGSSQPFTRF